MLDPDARPRGARRRAAPRPPQQAAGRTDPVRPRSLQADQRSLWTLVRRYRPDAHRQADARGVSVVGSEIALRRRGVSCRAAVDLTPRRGMRWRNPPPRDRVDAYPMG